MVFTFVLTSEKEKLISLVGFIAQKEWHILHYGQEAIKRSNSCGAVEVYHNVLLQKWDGWKRNGLQ